MGNEVFVPITSDILEKVYPTAEHIPLRQAMVFLSQGIGTLVFMSQYVRVIYGISYSREKDKYIIFLNFDGVEHLSVIDTLDQLFDAYGLDYSAFRYIALADLNDAVSDHLGKEAAEARTNSER
jgi:hypothetical protein